MHILVNDYRALLNYLVDFFSKDGGVLILEGVRGTGKTSLAARLKADIQTRLDESAIPVYQLFGDRKKLGLVDARVDFHTTSLVVMDVFRQTRRDEITIVDRNFLSTMVFNGWTHGQLTLARQLWREARAIHVIVEVCDKIYYDSAKVRTDAQVIDLRREDVLFADACKVALEGLPSVRYGNIERCGHNHQDAQLCSAATLGFDNALWVDKHV